jgi:polyisoprenoid-binding protein YceI
VSKAALFVFLSLYGAAAAAAPVRYEVDPDHSGVTFTIRHFVTNVPGRFRDFAGTIRYDKQSPTAASVSFTLEAASIDTANADRDTHLRSADFFDAERYPHLTFTATSVRVKDPKTLEITGDLTLKGITKRLTLPVQILGTVATPQGEKIGFETSFTVNRKDFGLTWNRVLEGGGALLGDDVRITVAVEASQVVAPAP